MTDGDILIALGEHDLAITRAEKALDELPEKKAILQVRHRIRELEGVREKAAAYQHKAVALVARSSDEIVSVEEKIDAEQAKVLSGAVTNPKELQNLTREIDSLARKKDTLERETLGLMEKAESGEAQVAKVDAALAEGRAKEAGLIERFRLRGGQVQADLERLKAERALLADRLPADLLERYERLRAAKHGIGVGVLTDGMCSACRTSLPADSAQRIEAGPEIAVCSNCRRLLVVRPGSRA
jgi:predicted  nucleic acid-binding Zn-ribbon protein